MDKETGFNQRRFERFTLRKPVAFSEEDEQPHDGSYGHDLSLGGICLEVNRLVPVGKYLTVNVTVADGQVVQAMAKVVWVSEVSMGDRYRIGLNFEQFVQGNAENIQQYLYKGSSV